MNNKISDENCPVRKALQIISGKWTLLIVFQISNKNIRYGDLKRSIPGISEKMLIEELKFLNQKGVVDKQVFKEVPPRTEYSLTDLGLKLLPIIKEIALFGSENL